MAMPSSDTWPCPFCPPGTDHFERVSANRTIIEYQCAGRTYKYREPANGRAAMPLPIIDMSMEDVGGFLVVSDVWACESEEVEAAQAQQ
jgi:hypothetical protein